MALNSFLLLFTCLSIENFLFRLKGVFILNIGNTVIHLDQALARMREYERMKIEAESTLDSEGCSSNFQGASAAKLEGMHIYTYFA